MQPANDKADTLFHRRPFHESRPAEFAAGQWNWTANQGMGLADYHAKVGLAANGSTNSLTFSFSMMLCIRFREIRDIFALAKF